MTQGDLSGNIAAAFRQLGATGGVSVSFGQYTAFPHGSIEPQRLKEGDFVQIDNGVSWNGYQADITRTTSSASRRRARPRSGTSRRRRRPPRSPPRRSAPRANRWTPPRAR